MTCQRLPAVLARVNELNELTDLLSSLKLGKVAQKKVKVSVLFLETIIVFTAKMMKDS